MPRFLNTSTGEFEWHNDPQHVVYAILSHTWRSCESGGEQSYGDVRALQAAVAKEIRKQQLAVVNELKHLASPQPSLIARLHRDPKRAFTRSSVLSHPLLSDKIKAACKVARQAGFRLIWNDACCIDKSSSAELSEAINSMYDWYRLSDVCYVYLEDVPDGEEPRHPESKFRESRWHRRGWTLQELIAPERVEFLTQSWRFLGTKIGLAATLEEISGIDVDILTGWTTVDSASVARRMSWAAKRETTRVEDEAYSLMGLFGVHMSPIYGEGKNAFLRLQEEIIKTVPDQSIFAWGRGCILRSLTDCHDPRYYTLDNPCLLASSPSAFEHCRGVTAISPSQVAPLLRLNSHTDVPPLHYINTSQGIRVPLLCLSLSTIPEVPKAFWTANGQARCDDCTHLGQADMLAVLQCKDEDGALVAIPLCQPRGEGERKRGLFIGTHIPCSKRSHQPFHIVRLTEEAVVELMKHAPPVSTEVSLLRTHSPPPVPKSLLHPKVSAGRVGTIDLWPGDHPDGVAFHITPRSIESLATLGFTPSALQVTRLEQKIELELSLAHTGDDYVLRDGEHRQTVRLRIELRQQRSGDFWFLTLWDTKASFSAENIIRFPPRNSASLSSASSLDTVSNPLPYTMRETPTARRSISEFDSQSAWRRLLVSAEFIIHSDAHWRNDACTVRRLKIALERPLESFAAHDTKNVWLSIELSEKYRYAHPGEPKPSSSVPEPQPRRKRSYEIDGGLLEIGYAKRIRIAVPNDDLLSARSTRTPRPSEHLPQTIRVPPSREDALVEEDDGMTSGRDRYTRPIPPLRLPSETPACNQDKPSRVTAVSPPGLHGLDTPGPMQANYDPRTMPAQGRTPSTPLSSPSREAAAGASTSTEDVHVLQPKTTICGSGWLHNAERRHLKWL